MTEQIKNFSQDVLVGDITSSDLTVVLSSASTFPTSGIFRIRIGNELLIVASVSGNTLTIQAGGRGAEGTVAASHDDGDDVFGPLTKVALENIIDQRAPSSVTMGGQVTGASSAATVANTHGASGLQSHAAAQTAAEATAATALNSHAIDTTSIHGITDTAVLATATSVATAVSAHTGDGTDAHAASAVSVVPFSTFTSTDVQNSLEEIAAAGGGGGGGTLTQFAVVVASNDMPATVKAAADFVCTGTNDQNTINNAINRAAAIAGKTSPGTAAPAVSGAQQRGLVQLTGGVFNIAGPILMRSAVRLSGAGMLTQLKAAATVANGGAGTQTGIIKKFDVNQHSTQVDHVLISGSGSTVQNAILYDGTASDYSTYPSSHSGDGVDRISDYWIYLMPTNGIHLTSTDSGNRAFDIGMGRIHITAAGSNNGVWLEGVPDGHIHDVQSRASGTGFQISGGNIKITNAKAWFCGTGFALASGRGVIAGCETQDSTTGFNVSSNPWAMSACESDTNSADGFVFSSGGVSATGLTSFSRSGTVTNGYRFSGSPVEMTVIGSVGSGVTTAVNGTAGARSFVRISTSTSLFSVG